MIKKYLSIVMAIGMLLTLMCSIPVSAATAAYPYMYNDFNEASDAPDYSGNMKFGILDGSGATVTQEPGAGVGGTGAVCIYDDEMKQAENQNGVFRLYVKNAHNVLLSETGFTIKFSMKVSSDTIVMDTVSNKFNFLFYGLKISNSRKTKTFEGTVTDLRTKLNSKDWFDVELTFPQWNGATGTRNIADDDPSSTYFMNVQIGADNRFVANGNSCKIWLDDFRMEPNAPASADPTKPSAEVTASLANVAEGHEVSLGYTFNGGSESLEEGNSIIRVLRETAAASGKFTPVAEFFKADYVGADPKFSIPDGYEGYKIKVEVLPVAADGTTVGQYAYATSGVIGKGTEIAISDVDTSAFASTNTVSANYSILNHKQDGTAINGVLVAIMYDGYEIVDYDFIDFSCALKADDVAESATTALTLTAGSGELTPDATAIAGIDKVKFFLWERDPSLDASAESKIFTVTMTELAAMQSIAK